MGNTFKYSEDWKTKTLVCPKCGWTGTFEEGDVEHHEYLFDCTCPRCDFHDAPILAKVMYPSQAEVMDPENKYSDEDIEGFQQQMQFDKDYEASLLRSIDQLPEIDGQDMVFTWDFVKGEQNETVISYGDIEVWREVASYECYERFGEIARMLAQKYGNRIIDLNPTERSDLYLFGDRLSSIDYVEDIRKKLRNHQLKG